MGRLPRLLVLIGSGELAAQMTRGHRMIVRRLIADGEQAKDVKAAIIDTTYGFQSNADALSATLVDYFDRRIGMAAAIASYRRADDDLLARETAFAHIREAQFVFAGPGSPSYALEHWAASPIPALLADKLATGGALVFASAAALTLGRLTVPVYEIYKAGADPYWLPGIDVLATIGISAVVIPHFDNAEGAGHDTRYCFLGEARLLALEAIMPDDLFILGIDEHTALLIDLDADSAVVHGRGGVTIRRHGMSTHHVAGEELPLALMRNVPDAPVMHVVPSAATDRDGGAEDLARRMVALAEQSSASAERASLVEPLIEALIAVRRDARHGGDYATADAIRDRLAELGVELTDASDGSTGYRLRDGHRPRPEAPPSE